MNKKIFLVPAVLFFLLISVFFYLLLIDRNPSELPSNLLNKKVPNFETESIFKAPNDMIAEINTDSIQPPNSSVKMLQLFFMFLPPR